MAEWSMPPPTLLSCLALTAAAMVLVGCGSTQQNMSLTVDSMATPPHNMSFADYPFDANGRYVDSWAAQGARRYGSRVNTDRQDHGRAPRKKPVASKPKPSSSRPKSASAGGTAKKPVGSPTKRPPTTARSHMVKTGDTLYSLSRRYGVSVQSIKNANGLKSDSIRDGRKLVIPR